MVDGDFPERFSFFTTVLAHRAFASNNTYLIVYRATYVVLVLQ